MKPGHLTNAEPDGISEPLDEDQSEGSNEANELKRWLLRFAFDVADQLFPRVLTFELFNII